MTLSTGKTAFMLEFDNGDTGIIYININDSELFDRLKAFGEKVNARIAAISTDKYKAMYSTDIKLDLNDPLSLLDAPKEELDMLIANAEAINAVENEYNKAIKDEIDRAFNSKISDVVFKYCEPFAKIIVENDDGTTRSIFYIEQFVEWFATEVKKYNEKSNLAMQKHLEKYKK